jgi:hypothetical protein
VKNYFISFSLAEEDKILGSEEGDDASEEAAGEEEEVSCDCSSMPATNSIDVFCVYNTNFPIFVTSVVKNVFI